MSKTGNPAEIARLNHLLGAELGLNVYGAAFLGLAAKLVF